MNIVVVEDHDDLRDITVQALRNMGHQVSGVDCAEALVDALEIRSIDLLVLDLNLPGESGITLARRMRATQPYIGIIMLTARQQLADKIAGYANGADIYLTKPTSTDELTAAVQALGRRMQIHLATPAAFVLDVAALTLQGPASLVGLSLLEANMLLTFSRARDSRLEHWQLMAMSETGGSVEGVSVAGEHKGDLSKNTLEAQIARLRKKLMQAGAVKPPIISIRGQGYQFCLVLTSS